MNINPLEFMEILTHVAELKKKISNIQKVIAELRRQYNYTEALLSFKTGAYDKLFIRDAFKTFESIENILHD